MLRIRGSIIDNIRKIDWVPRLVRLRNAKLEKLRQKILKETGENPTKEEICKELEITDDEYEKFMKKSTPIDCCNIYTKTDESGENKDYEVYSVISNEKEPLNNILKSEFFEKILSDLARLEKKIIYLFYYEKMSIKEIAEKTKLSESRISQMHSNIIKRLNKKALRNPKYFESLEKVLS